MKRNARTYFLGILKCSLLMQLVLPHSYSQSDVRIEANTASTFVGFSHGSLELDSTGAKVLDFWTNRMDKATEFPDGLALCFKGYSCNFELSEDPYIHLKRCKVVIDYFSARTKPKIRFVIDPVAEDTHSIGTKEVCAAPGVDFRLIKL